MPLPVVPEGTHLLTKSKRFDVFCEFARYQPLHARSGSDRYAICVGRFVGGTMFAPDTMELRNKFDAWVLRKRRVDRDKIARPWRVYDALSQRNLPRYFSTRKSAVAAAREMNGAHYTRFFVKKAKERE
jgi:hypothetical protein